MQSFYRYGDDTITAPELKSGARGGEQHSRGIFPYLHRQAATAERKSHIREELAMWSRLYRNHVIMAFPTYDTVRNAWAPQADINWFAGSSRDSSFVQFSKRCTSEEEAVTWALRRSEVWVDNRLRRLSRAIVPGRARGIDMIKAAKSHLGKVTPKQTVRAPSVTEPRPEKKLTFYRSSARSRELLRTQRRSRSNTTRH